MQKSGTFVAFAGVQVNQKTCNSQWDQCKQLLLMIESPIIVKGSQVHFATQKV